MNELSNLSLGTRLSTESSPAKLSNLLDLYFVRVGPHLKIGRTRNLNERLRIIGTHSATPPELVGVLAGEGCMEPVWHYAFRRVRTRGEWFRIVPPLKQTVDAALRGEDWIATCGPSEWRQEVAAFAEERGLRTPNSSQDRV